jgi:hypothetical protein
MAAIIFRQRIDHRLGLDNLAETAPRLSQAFSAAGLSGNSQISIYVACPDTELVESSRILKANAINH